MDFETVLINNVHTPYLLCWYDGKNTYNHYISSLNELALENNITKMISEAMDLICTNKYKNYSIYLHNFSKFDGYFLIRHLAKLGITSPIMNNGKIITTSFTHNKSLINITFKDSLLLLPASLKKLGDSFNVLNKKTIFPYLLSDIFYKGKVPIFDMFTNITLEEYNKYKLSYTGKVWSFKDEAIKYCNIDCICLYEIITKFNMLIFNRFNLCAAMKYPTVSSLAFGIWKTHYLKDDSNELGIHKLSGQVANEIRNGYTGGAVDMYIPKPYKKELVYCYDVNSLYPSVMLNNLLAVGQATFFNGNILKNCFGNNPFGFFYCKITAPKYIEHPIIQTHVKTKNGTRTVAPLGQWQDMIFSEEMFNAMKYGYKFEVLWGYTFNKAIIFKEYVENIYNLRLQYPKTDPMNYIAKLLLNSLYGSPAGV